jgi:hypothetical protein
MKTQSRIPSRTLRVLALALIAGFAGLQFVRPRLGNEPVTANLKVPADVEHVLRTSCYNCHSYETKLAWFDQVVPAYWLVVDDVRKGRSHLNFSELGRQTPAQQSGVLFEAINQVQLGAMPPASYRLAHPEARLSSGQLTVLKDYLESLETRGQSSSRAITAASEEYAKWTQGGSVPGAVQPVPNGIEFPAGYTHWKAISSTDREDNHTLRQVLGNDVAVKAIEAGEINPWPDGAMFAKIGWEQVEDSNGLVQSGQFKQVEFMIKDRKKYASTAGWGWARWLGTDLRPFGQSSDFAESCVSCHTPMRGNDFVFTIPLKSYPTHDSPEEVSSFAGLPSNPLQGEVITSTVDRRTSTMSTFFGNEPAVQTARTGPNAKYPAGSVLALVTWQEKEDPHWFGAEIPGEVKSVEYVVVTAIAEKSERYTEFKGSPLRKSDSANDPASENRMRLILQMRAAVMPDRVPSVRDFRSIAENFTPLHP